MTQLGASREAWAHFDLVLGLTEDLLPVVSDPATPIAQGSALASVGKVPSRLNSAGKVVGIPGWTERRSKGAAIERWAEDPRLGICLQTRRVRAFDIDIEDPAKAAKAVNIIEGIAGPLPCRTRANSGKRLLASTCESELHKDVLPVGSERVELLATGQQFVACSTHPSGVPYRWQGGLPDRFPPLTIEQVDAIRAALRAHLGTDDWTGSRGPRQKGDPIEGARDEVAAWLFANGLVRGQGRDGALYVECPWKHEHTSDSGVTETAWFPAGTNGYERGGFRCLHAHCADRGASDFEEAVGYAADDFEPLTEPTEPSTSVQLISATPYTPRDPAAIPARPWVYGRQLLRGSLSLLVAPGASGKTSLLAATALALATGCPLLGYPVHDGPKRVWLWNLEDSLDELARLIEAARAHYMIGAEEIAGRLFVDSGVEGAALCLAAQRPGKAVELAEATFAAIEREIEARRIDVLILDPFVSAHRAAENDNGAIDAVAKRLARIAVNTNCSVLVSHHTAKLGGSEVSAEKARGASALVNAARSAVAINRLAANDAPKIGVPIEQAARHFRVFDDKNNRAPPATSSEWFRLVSVELGNGDSLPVAERYYPPEVSLPEVDPSAAVEALGDRPWRDNKQSPEWAGYRVALHLGWDVGAAGASRSAEQLAHLRAVEALLAQAVAAGLVEKVQLPGPDRKFKPFLRVAAAPAAPCGTPGSASAADCGAAPLSPLGEGAAPQRTAAVIGE